MRNRLHLPAESGRPFRPYGAVGIAVVLCTGSSGATPSDFPIAPPLPVSCVDRPAVEPLTLASQGGPSFGAPAVASPYGVDGYERLGPGDLLELSVFGLPELSTSVRVAQDGSVSLPLIGSVSVSGRTPREIETTVAGRLRAEYLHDPQVSVVVRERRWGRTIVLGAVEQPGSYELTGSRTVLELLSEAGGVRDDARRQVQLIRHDPGGTQARIDIDLDEVLAGGAVRTPSLQPGDVLYVPEDRPYHIYVTGAVGKPGAYEIESSRRLSLLQAVALAEGMSPTASGRGVQIHRRHDDGGVEILRYNLKRISNGKQDDVELAAGDVIIVPEALF